MIDNKKLIVDQGSEVATLLQSMADDTFWDFAQHQVVPGSVYVFSMKTLGCHTSYIKELLNSDTIHAVLGNPAEGADTMWWYCHRLDLFDHVRQRKLLLVTGGLFHNAELPALLHEHFLVQMHNYSENKKAITDYRINNTDQKPFKFLFLNGRMRVHRHYLLDRFRTNGLLESSIWTNLDPRVCAGFRYVEWYENEDFAKPQHGPVLQRLRYPFPVQRLPSKYEVDRYRSRPLLLERDRKIDLHVKHHLFDWEWGEVYLEPQPYLDTYFSLVTETVFDYPCSFRTEKIWKPVAIGHPWIAVANAGYYRDMHNLGFQTFGHLIDETFDHIEQPQDRCERIAQIVEDLCQQDLVAFAKAAKSVCDHNQNLMQELHITLQQRFIPRFQQFILDNFA